MTLALKREGVSALVPPLDRGLSDEAREVRERGDLAIDTTTSITLGSPKRATVEALEEALRQAQEAGWDGYGATPADPEAFLYALQFLARLPTGWPVPEIAVDVEGDIAVEWDYGPRRVFSVRVGRDGTLEYAGLVGLAKFYGTELLLDAIPSAISTGLDRVIQSAPG